MEAPPPFDLNRRVQDWRRTLAESAAVPRDQLDELEDHVRTSFANLQSTGLSADEAFLLAVRRVGTSEALAREYLKVNPERAASAYFFGILLRHKWSLLGGALAGLLAVAGVYLFHKPPFTSEAVLFIRYITENGSPASGAPGSLPGGSRSVEPEQAGAALLNTEVQILRSMDLDYRVADLVGVGKLLGGTGGLVDRDRAALEVQSDLAVQPVPGSGTIRLAFSHRDPDTAQPALKAVVDAYLRKHVEVHRPAGEIGDFLSQEVDQLRSRLVQTEDELRKTMDQAGIVSLDSAKDLNSQMESRIQQEILTAEADLAERSTGLAEDAKLSFQGAPGNSSVERPEIAQDRIRVAALHSRISFLEAKLGEVRAQAAKVDQLEGTINELQRQKELDETNYRYYTTRLEATRIEEALGTGHALNIALVQTPTIPRTDWTGTIVLMVWLGGGGLGLGVALACLNEFFRRRLRRSSDDEPPHYGAAGFREPVPVRDV